MYITDAKYVHLHAAKVSSLYSHPALYPDPCIPVSLPCILIDGPMLKVLIAAHKEIFSKS